jgi:SMI1-KNR4 cell-wall
MNDNQFLNIVDKHLQRQIDLELNSLPVEIEPEMANPSEPMNDEGWQKWYPINSIISDSEIENLEEQLKVRLPTSYKSFIKHKHFYELCISDALFRGQEIRDWKRNLVNMVFDGYPREYLYDKGYIPFADWSDWGLLCFDTNSKTGMDEYPIVLWDHERWEKFEFFSENFSDLLIKLDKLSDFDGS